MMLLEIYLLLIFWVGDLENAYAENKPLSTYTQIENDNIIEYDKDVVRIQVQNGRLFVQQMNGFCSSAKGDFVKKKTWLFYDKDMDVLIGIPSDDKQNPIRLCENVFLEVTFTKMKSSESSVNFHLYFDRSLDEISLREKLSITSTFEMYFKNDYTLTTRPTNITNCYDEMRGGEVTTYKLLVQLNSMVTLEQIKEILVHLILTKTLIGYQICWLKRMSFQNHGRKPRSIGEFFNLANFQSNTATNCDRNTHPVAKSNLQTVEIPMNRFDHIRLSPDLFVDAEDGNAGKLRLELKWADGKPILLSDWLQYNTMLQLAYTWATYEVYLKQPKNGYNFIIIATDNCGSNITMKYNIKIRNDDYKPPCYSFVLLVETIMDVNTPMPHILTDLVNIISVNFNDTKLSKHLIQNLDQQLESNKNLFSIFFSDQSVQCDPCDTSRINRIQTAAKSNKHFHKSFLPNFKFLGFTVKWDSCNGESNPVVLCPIPDLVVTSYRSVHYSLPLNTFYDAQDGFTAELKLKIVHPFPQPFTAFLDGLDLFVYQYGDKEQHINGKRTLMVEASDSENTKAALYFMVEINEQPLISPGYFTFKFFSYYEHSISKGQILQLILRLISDYLQEKIHFGNFVILKYTKIGSFPQAIELSFSRKEFYFTNGGYRTFLSMRNKLFYNGLVSNLFIAYIIRYIRDIDGSFVDNFNHVSRIHPTPYQTEMMKTTVNTLPMIQSSHIAASKATATPTHTVAVKGPHARYKIGPFKITFCDFLVFPIAEDLFYDLVDGFTSKLKLSLHTVQNKPVDTKSWILVDSNIQVIYGYLKLQDYVQSGGKHIFYNLVATNSRGFSTSLLFQVNLPEKLPEVLYTVTMTVTQFYQEGIPEINEQLLLLTKISAYFGKPSKFSWINIVSFTRKKYQNRITVAWTNCTLSASHQCPNNDITTIASKVVLDSGIPNTNFARFMSPQYIIHNIYSTSNQMTCQTTTTTLPTSSITMSSFPIIVNKIPTLKVVTFHYFTFKIPFNTFYDSTDGYTPYLTLSMSNANGKTFDKSSWIQFNSAAQEITAFLFVDILQGVIDKEFKFVLTATNSFNRAKNMIVTAECVRSTIPTGGVYVEIEGNEYFSSTMNDIQILVILLQRYFQYTGPRWNTEIVTFERNKNVISTFNVRLMYHRISASQCNETSVAKLRNMLLTQQELINPNFIVAFLSEAVAKTVKLTKFGLCQQPVTTPSSPGAPLVLNQIPILEVSNSGFFQYTIPQKTFYDPIDGYTPSLQLQLLDKYGKLIKTTSWISLSTNQVLIASPSPLQSQETQFILRAINQRNFYVDMKLQFIVTIVSTSNLIKITLSGIHQFQPVASNVDIIVYIMEKFNSYVYSETNRKATVLVQFDRQSPQFSIIFADKENVNCNTLAYQKLYSKIYSSSGSINTRLVTELHPMVSLTHVKLSDNCVQTTSKPVNTTQSTNKPPYVNSPIRPIQLVFGRLLFHYIEASTFLDREDGDIKSLDLKLLHKNGEEISEDSWIQFNQNVHMIYGAYTLHDYNTFIPAQYEFILQATDSNTLSVSTPVKLMPPKTRLTYSFKVKTVINTFYQTSASLVNEQLLFVTKMNKMFSKYTRNGIQLIIFNRNKDTKQLIIEWTFDNLDTISCPFSVLDKVSSKLAINNEPTSEYKSALSPEYESFHIELIRSAPCMMVTLSPTPSSQMFTSTRIMPTPTGRPPTINILVPPLSLKLCSMFVYYIPRNTFLDPNDGSYEDMELQVLTQNGGELSYNSWLAFNKIHKYLYGLITDEDVKSLGNIKAVVYRLQAKNNYGTVFSYVTLYVPTRQLTSHSITFVFETQKSIPKKADLTVMFLGKLSTYLKESSTVQLLKIVKMQEEFWSVTFTACEDMVKNCTDIEMFQQKFFKSANEVSVTFKNFLLPDITIIQAYYSKENCHVMKTTQSTTTTVPKVNLPPIVLKLFQVQSITRCKPFEYKIPENTFFDVEDGLSMDLKLEVKNEDGNTFDKDTWITFNASSQTLKGVLTSIDIVQKQKFTFRVIATDKGGLSVYQYLTIKLEKTTSYLDGHMIDTYGTVYGNFKKSEIQLMTSLRIYDFLKTKSNYNWDGIQVYSFTLYDTNPPSFNMKWSVCEPLCNPNTVNEMKSILWVKERIVKSEFSVLLHPTTIITSVAISDGKDCQPTRSSTASPTSSLYTTTPLQTTQQPGTNTPPFINQAVPVLYIQSCTPFQYQIPPDTCMDKEDGPTPKLTIKLLKLDHTEVGYHSWINLNKPTQRIKVILKTIDMENSLNNVFIFYLVCEDKEGLSVLQRIHIVLQAPSQPPPYYFITKSYIYVDDSASDVDIQSLWITKVKNYLKDQENNIQIISYDKSIVLYPQIVVKWYNCSIQDPCSNDALYLKETILNKRNHHSVNTKFSQAMVPEFVMISGSFKQSVECYIDITTTAPPSTTPNLNNKPITIMKNLNLNLDPCIEMVYKIPSNTFYDIEEGYTANLKLELMNSDGSEMNDPCIWFDSNAQTLYAHYVIENMKNIKEVKLRLVAYDKYGASAYSIVVISLKRNVDVSNHWFTLRSYVYNMVPDKLNILKSFTAKIKNYYGNARAGQMLFKKLSYSKDYMEVSWANCTILSSCMNASIVEVKSKILLYDSIISSQFIAAMAPSFILTHLEFNYGSLCSSKPATTMIITSTSAPSLTTSEIIPTSSANTPPKVIKKIPVIEVPICSPFSYRIPEDIFLDRQDGNTRGLTIVLTQFNGQMLPKTSWIQYVESSQVIYGHIKQTSLNDNNNYISYILRAYDKEGLNTFTIITLKLPVIKQTPFFISAEFTRFFDERTPDLISQLFLASKISTYVGDLDVSKIFVISLTRKAEIIELSWTNCTLLNGNCKNNEVRQSMEKFVKDGNIVNDNFQKTMNPYYTVLSINTSCARSSVAPSSLKPSKMATQSIATQSFVIPANKPPVINRLIAPIDIKICGSFSYTIADDTFIDEDGSTLALKIQLFDILGKEVNSRTSWVQYNSKLLLIYGLIKCSDVEKQPVSGYRYILKATDSQGLSSSIILPFIRVDHTTNIGFTIVMEIQCSFEVNTPFINDIFQIINKIVSFFGDKNAETIKVVDLYEKQRTKDTIIFKWTNCTLDFSTCPFKMIGNIREKVGNAAFQKSLQPNYIVKKIDFLYTFPCKEPVTTLPPILTTTPTPNRPKIKNYIPTIITKKCSRLSFEIPNNTFYDQEDGWTPNLDLILAFVDEKPLPKSYWIQFDATTQTIIGNPKKSKQVENPYNSYIFSLTAKDKENNQANLLIRIDVTKHLDVKMYQNFTLFLKKNFPLTIPDENKYKEKLLKKISLFNGDDDNYFLEELNFKNNADVIEISWTNCTLSGESCNHAIASNLKNKIMDVNGKCRSQFAFVFLPEFSVQSLTITTDSKCNLSTIVSPTPSSLMVASSSTPPIPETIRVIVPEIFIKVSYCKQIEYMIPENIFYDERDGNTRSFSYALHFKDNLPVTCNSWLQLNKTTNKIYGNTLQTQLPNPIEYRLRAQNNVGSTAKTTLRIDTSDLLLKNLTYRAAFSFQTSLSMKICDSELLSILKDKLVKYFKDDTDQYLSFVFFSRGVSGQPSYIMWSNCTIRTDICDFRHINEISSKLFDKETSIPNPNLVNSLLPEFTDLSVLEEKLGPCSANKVLAVGISPKPVCVASCGEFVYKLEETLFFGEEGNTSKLLIEVSHKDGTSLSVDSWIQFDQGTQTLYGFLTESVFANEPEGGYAYNINAYDKNGGTAQVPIIFKTCGEKPSYEASVTMQLECNETITKAIDVVGHTFHKLSEAYIDGSLDTFFLVKYNSILKNINFTWANCTGSASLTLDQVIDATTNESGCVPLNLTYHNNKDYPPTAHKKSLRYEISFCHPKQYLIPYDVITDNEDGDMRNMSVYLAYQNFQKIPSNYFVALEKNLNLIFLTTNKTRTKTIYEFYLIVEDRKNQTAKVLLYFEVLQDFPEVNFMSSISYRQSKSISVAENVYTLLRKLNEYMELNQTWNVADYQWFENGTYLVEFTDCSLSYPKCSYEKIGAYEKMLMLNNEINPDLMINFFPEYTVQKVKTQKYGNCLLQPNHPPSVKLETNLTITKCGISNYLVPEDTFYDQEDGSTRNLTLKMFYEENCWMKFNNSSQTISIVYDPDIARKQPHQGYMFILQATDSRGESVNNTVHIFLAPNKQTSFQMVLIFDVLQKLPCFEEKLYLLEKLLNTFNNTSQLGLSSISRGTGNMIEVILEDCAMRYSPCDFLAIDKMVLTLITGSTIKKEVLDLFSTGYYVPKYLSLRKAPPCLDRSNKDPTINGTIGYINVTTCMENATFTLPKNLVLDDEDGDWSQMNKILLNARNIHVSTNSWISLNVEKLSLTILFIREIALQQPTTGYGFNIQVTDSRGAIVYVPFTIFFNKNDQNKTFIIQSMSEINENLTDVLMKWKNLTEVSFNTHIEFLSYKLVGSQLSFEWLICDLDSTNCPRKTLQSIENYYQENNMTLNLTKYGDCLRLPSKPPTTSNLTVLLEPCKKIHFSIPNDLFSDDVDGGTANLSVSIKQLYPLENAWFLRYNQSQKLFEGIIIMQFFVIYGHIDYHVTAVDSDGLHVNTTIRFVIPKDLTRQYEFTVRAIHYLVLPSDRSFVEQFCERLLHYLDVEDEGMIIYNTSKVIQSSLPKYDIIFTPCLLTGRKCNVLNVEKITRKMISDQEQPSFNFIKAMLDNIVPESIKFVNVSMCSENKITTSNKTVILKSEICDKFSFTFSEDLFLQTKVKPLTYTISEPYQWITFNVTSQTGSIRPKLRELRDQPANGYSIILNAQDINRNVASRNVSVFIKGNITNYNFMVTFNISGNIYGKTKNELINDFQKRIESQTKGTSFTNILIADLILPEDKDSTAQLFVYDCHLNTKYCQTPLNEKFLSIFVNKNGSVRPSINNVFVPEYKVENVSALPLSKCKNISEDSPYVTGEIPTLNMSLCKKLQYVIPAGLFMDGTEGELSGNNIKLCGKDGAAVRRNSFIQYEQNQRLIYGLITQDIIKMYTQKTVLFYLKGTNSKGKSANITVIIQLPQSVTNNLIITTTSKTYKDPTLSDFDVLMDIYTRITKYLGMENEQLSIIKMAREGNLPQKISLEWTSCSLIGITCQKTVLEKIIEKVFLKDNIINPYYIDALGRNLGFIHTDTILRKINSCLHPGGNEEPVANKNMSLVISKCGSFRKQLDNDMFTDKENGDIRNLTLTLMFLNGSKVEDDFWIGYEAELKYVFGMLPAAETESVNSSFVFLIVASDDSNKRAQGFLFVYVNDSSNHFEGSSQEVTTIVQCNNSKLPNLVDIISILNLTADVLNVGIEHIRLTKYFGNSTTTTIEWSSCIPVNLTQSRKTAGTTIGDCRTVAVNIETKSQSSTTTTSTPTVSTTSNVPVVKNYSCCMYIMLVLENINSLEDKQIMFDVLKNDIYAGGPVDVILVDVYNNKTSNKDTIIYTDNKLTNKTCYLTNTKSLTDPVFIDSNNTQIKTSFIDSMKQYKTITGSVLQDPACNQTAIVVPPIFTSSALSGDFISTSDWFFYLLPLFILAFLFLMCCICYYCCRYCYNSCISPRKYILANNGYDNPALPLSPLPYNTLPKENLTDNDFADAAPFQPKNAAIMALPVNMEEIDDIEENAVAASQTQRQNTIKQKKTTANSQVSSLIQQVFIDEQEKEKGIDFSDRLSKMYTRPNRNGQRSFQRKKTMKTSRDNVSQRLVKSEPITTSYTVAHTGTVNVPSKQSVRVDTRRNLRLPAIPTGPPPPYSPPRMHRIFRQNILPSYYERYIRQRRHEPSIAVPLSPELIAQPRKTVFLASPKPKRLISLPLKRRKREERIVTPVITIPDFSESTPSDESSIEMKAIIKGKQRIIRQLLSKSPNPSSFPRKKKKKRQYKEIVEIPLSPIASKRRYSTSSPLVEISKTQSRKHHPYSKFKHKLSKPFLYDYIPVRRKQLLRASKKYVSENSINKKTYATLSRKMKKKSRIEENIPPTLEELLDESLEIDDKVHVSTNDITQEKKKKRHSRRISWIDIKDINLKE